MTKSYVGFNVFARQNQPVQNGFLLSRSSSLCSRYSVTHVNSKNCNNLTIYIKRTVLHAVLFFMWVICLCSLWTGLRISSKCTKYVNGNTDNFVSFSTKFSFMYSKGKMSIWQQYYNQEVLGRVILIKEQAMYFVGFVAS